jgi:hypothetical protein
MLRSTSNIAIWASDGADASWFAAESIRRARRRPREHAQRARTEAERRLNAAPRAAPLRQNCAIARKSPIRDAIRRRARAAAA